MHARIQNIKRKGRGLKKKKKVDNKEYLCIFYVVPNQYL